MKRESSAQNAGKELGLPSIRTGGLAASADTLK